MALRLDGQRISRICFDYAITLATESGFEIRLEAPFTYRSPDGEIRSVDPELAATTASDLLAVLQVLIDFVEVADSGLLRIVFLDGHELSAAPNDEFEAWTATGPGDERVVCLPGGGLSVWSPTNE